MPHQATLLLCDNGWTIDDMDINIYNNLSTDELKHCRHTNQSFWFVEKYDYKNRDADWKNSKDAIQRGMQKLRGSDPSLPPHVLKK